MQERELHDVFQKSNGPSLRYYHVLQRFYVMNLYIHVLLALLLLFFNMLPSEFQVIILGSKKQQQKDSYIHAYIYFIDARNSQCNCTANFFEKIS